MGSTPHLTAHTYSRNGVADIALAGELDLVTGTEHLLDDTWPPGPVEDLAEIATEVITSALKCSEWRSVRVRSRHPWSEGTFGTALILAGGCAEGRARKTIDPSGTVSDGSSVAASGYIMITADSMGDAVEKAKGCPALGTSNTINVFETATMGGN